MKDHICAENSRSPQHKNAGTSSFQKQQIYHLGAGTDWYPDENFLKGSNRAEMCLFGETKRYCAGKATPEQ
jgi:hypothetical protein